MEISDKITEEPVNIHFLKSREIAKIREEKWTGLVDHVLNYSIQKISKLIGYLCVFLYYKHPSLGEVYDRINPLP